MWRFLHRVVRHTWGLLTLVILVGAVIFAWQEAFTAINWTLRSEPTSSTVTPTQSPAPSLTPTPEVPAQLAQAGLIMQSIVSKGTLMPAGEVATGGSISGACTPAAWPVILSSEAVNTETGVQALAAVSTVGRGEAALADAVKQVSACPEAYVTYQYTPDGEVTQVTTPTRSWLLARHLDIVLTVGYLDTGSLPTALASISDMLKEAKSVVSGCYGSGDPKLNPYKDKDPYLETNAIAGIAPASVKDWVIIPSSAPSASTSPNPVFLPEPSPVPSLAPLLSREQGGDGFLRAEAPLLVDPASIPEPLLPDPGAAPVADSSPEITPTTVQVVIPVADTVGPGCGWEFTGAQPPNPPDTKAVHELLVQGYLKAAKAQTSSLSTIVNWPATYSKYLAETAAWQEWSDYRTALAEAQSAWDQAVSSKAASEAAWAAPEPLPSPDPVPVPTPSPSLPVPSTSTPAVTP